MEFGDILTKSWEDYKLNFRTFFWLLFYFVAIPFFILNIFIFYFSYSNGLFDSESLKNFTFNFEVLREILLLLIVLIIAFFVSFFAYFSLMAISLKKEKFTFKNALNEGKKYYWRSIGFFIVFIIFLGLLFFSLIIPGIIFLVYWIFAYAVFIKEEREIIDSLKRSFYLVKNRWWNTFGYVFLFSLITLGISLVLSIPGVILDILSSFDGLTSPGYLVSFEFMNFIFSMADYFITIPLGVFFAKNMYFDYLKRK